MDEANSSRLYSSSYDPYYASFMKGESFRESCYQCLYSSLNRVGDITIGDCDSAELYADFHPNQAKSTVIINNAHGAKWWLDVHQLFDYKELDIEEEAIANHQLSHPVARPTVRDVIYKDVKKLGFWSLKKKYAFPKTSQQKILSLIQGLVPSLYRYILRNTK